MPGIRTRAAICTILSTRTTSTGEFDMHSLQANFEQGLALKNCISQPIDLLGHTFIFFCYRILM
jgi:hypothetical protein